MTELRKDGPAVGDVHVASSLGSKKKKTKKPKGDATFTAGTTVVKVDSSLGLVMGWAIICKRDGEDYFDLQKDHIPETAMLEAALDFVENGAIAKEMHDGEA